MHHAGPAQLAPVQAAMRHLETRVRFKVAAPGMKGGRHRAGPARGERNGVRPTRGIHRSDRCCSRTDWPVLALAALAHPPNAPQEEQRENGRRYRLRIVDREILLSNMQRQVMKKNLEF